VLFVRKRTRLELEPMQRYTDPILARADVSRPLGRVLAPEQAEALRAGGAILTPAEVARDADGGDPLDRSLEESC